MFFPFLFSFFLSQWFLLSTSHAQNNHHSRIVRTMNKVFAHREPRESPKRFERGRRVCTRCTLLECQSIIEFAEVHKGCFRVKLSLSFFLHNNHNKKFIKDSGLAEIESMILPQIIRIKLGKIAYCVIDIECEKGSDVLSGCPCNYGVLGDCDSVSISNHNAP
jgi:hypothetical protein